MKLRMLKTAAGPEGTWSGTVTYRVPEDMSEAQAKEFVKRHVAVWLDASPVVEQAVAEEPRAENTDARPKRKRGRPRKVKTEDVD